MIHRLASVGSVVVFLVACSGSSGTPESGGSSSGGSGTGSSGGSSGGHDDAGGGSSSGGSSTSSGSTSGGGSSGGGTSSSGSASSSSSGSSGGGDDAGSYVCSSPSDCTTAGSGDVCCAHIPVTGGTVPNCTTGALTVACSAAAQCPTQLGQITCSGTEVVRLCSQAADCTETGAPKCCTFTQGTGSISFCANAIVAAVAKATCM
jgi:hypothetical protein